MIGETLGPYEVIARLGAGGMGDVYRAHDPKLKRDIAIKVLPAELAEDAERRERFEREAIAVAALDHPNIVTVYTVEEADGLHFITMQLVEGKTLSELIPRQGLALEKFFELAVPLADAIGAAHEHGVAHRDLKPANVMVAEDGRVKVLDFGLAKLMDDDTDADVATQMATEHLTEEGKILGTVAYMSPEQAEGKEIDHRSDIFSLGILLYEMVTGEGPFTGDTKLSVMSSIVKDTPISITEVNPRVPRHLGRIVKHALEKDLKKRYQSAVDLKNELEELAAEVKSGEVLPAGAVVGAGRSGLGWRGVFAIAAAVVTIAVVYGAWEVLPWAARDEEPWILESAIPLTAEPGPEFGGSISPAGDRIVYSAGMEPDIWVRATAPGSNAFNLTENLAGIHFSPVFDAAGERIAFASYDEGEGGSGAYVMGDSGIYVMGATGEGPRHLSAGTDPTWSPDGEQIAYTTASVVDPRDLSSRNPEIRIYDLALDQENPTIIANGYQPKWSPGGKRIAYFALDGGNRDIRTVGIGGGDEVYVTQDADLDWSPEWSPDGRHLFFSSSRGGSDGIWRVRIDQDTGEVLDEPQRVYPGGADTPGFLSFSADGNRLLFSALRQDANIRKVSFDPVAEEVVGEPEDVTSGTRRVWWFDVAPDGERLVFANIVPTEDLFTIRADGSGQFRVTNNLVHDRRPRWSPTDDRIAVYSDRGGSYEMWTMDPDGGSPKQHTSGAHSWWPTWSPDGDRLVFWIDSTPDEGLAQGAYIVDANLEHGEQAPPTPLPYSAELEAPFFPNDWASGPDRLLGSLGSVLNDGIWLYDFETGTYRQVTEQGLYVQWMPDGQRFLYTLDGALMLGDVAGGEPVEILDISPGFVLEPKVAAPDGNHTIYYVHLEPLEADIWLLTREPNDGR